MSLCLINRCMIIKIRLGGEPVMDLAEIANSIVAFSKDNPVVAVAAAVLLVFLIYLRPKLFLSLMFLAVFLVGIYYLIMSMAGSGVSQKGRLIEKGVRQIEER